MRVTEMGIDELDTALGRISTIIRSLFDCVGHLSAVTGKAVNMGREGEISQVQIDHLCVQFKNLNYLISNVRVTVDMRDGIFHNIRRDIINNLELMHECIWKLYENRFKVDDLQAECMKVEVYFSSLMYLQGRQEGFAEGL